VLGHGFAPGSQVRLKLCDPAQGPDKACDSDLGEGPVRVDTDGSFGRGLRVRAGFDSVDCLRTRCAVATTKVGGGGDRSQEAYLSIGFRGEAPGLPATWAPSPAVAPGGNGASAAPSPPPPPASPSASSDSASSRTGAVRVRAARRGRPVEGMAMVFPIVPGSPSGGACAEMVVPCGAAGTLTSGWRMRRRSPAVCRYPHMPRSSAASMRPPCRGCRRGRRRVRVGSPSPGRRSRGGGGRRPAIRSGSGAAW
jgi:hypothetical protein